MALPSDLERHIASLCEQTHALALVSRAWRSAAHDAESHEPLSPNGSTWCHRSAALNGPVAMRYLKRIDLTLYGPCNMAPTQLAQLLDSAHVALSGRLRQTAETLAANANAATTGPALFVSGDTFSVCGFEATQRFLQQRTWQVFSCIDFDCRVGPWAFYVDAVEVHVNASLMATVRLGPSVRSLFVYEDPAALWCDEALQLESQAFERAWHNPGLECLVFQGLLSPETTECCIARRRGGYTADGAYGAAFGAPLRPLRGLRKLVLIHTTRAPWTVPFGDFLGAMAPSLEALTIYGSNLILTDLVALGLWRWRLKALNVEDNYTLRAIPHEALAHLDTLQIANTGIYEPPTLLRPLTTLSCNYCPSWSAFLEASPLSHVKLVYMGLVRGIPFPAKALQKASLVELDLKDRFNQDLYFAGARNDLQGALICRPMPWRL